MLQPAEISHCLLCQLEPAPVCSGPQFKDSVLPAVFFLTKVTRHVKKKHPSWGEKSC